MSVDKILDADGNEMTVRVVHGGRFRLTAFGEVTEWIDYAAPGADALAAWDRRRLLGESEARDQAKRLPPDDSPTAP